MVATMKEEVTDEQKVRTLRAANPKLTEQDACTLLGIDFNTFKCNDFLNIFRDITKEEK